ncbi:hypothetical protein ACFL6C_00365 [Myxococcota bacterium]
MIRPVMLVVCLVSCSDRKTTACPAGEVEYDGACRQVCTNTCTESGMCCHDAVCLPCSGQPPVVSHVDGSGSPDTSGGEHGEKHIRDRLLISGQYLSDATAILVGQPPLAASHALNPCLPATEDQLQVSLPTDLEAGDYALTVTNQAGSCDVDLRILQGEPTHVDACAAGSSIRAINADGTVDCEIDDTALGGAVVQATAGRLVYFDGVDTLMGSRLFQDTDNVGVGTNTPSAALAVKGTLSQPLTGTVSVTASADQLTGVSSSTSFVSELNVGDAIQVGSEVFTVAAITDDYTLTLDSPHQAGAGNVTAYTDNDLLVLETSAEQAKLLVDKSGNLTIAGVVDIGLEIVSASHSLDPWGSSSVSVDCPPGKRLLGGGCHGSRVNSENCNIPRNYPSSGTTWHCHAQSSSTADLTLTAYAICARAR